MAAPSPPLAAQKLNDLLARENSLDELNAALSEAEQALAAPGANPDLALDQALARAYTRRYRMHGSAADAASAATTWQRVAGAIQSAELWLQYATALIYVYEVSGDASALNAARDLCADMAQKVQAKGLDPLHLILANALLLQYRATGGPQLFNDAYALSRPARFTETRPPSIALYLAGASLRESYRRTGSLNQLEESTKTLGYTTEAGQPPIVKFIAEYSEALLDRYRIYPAFGTLDLATKTAGQAVDKYLPAADGPDCRMAAGYAYVLSASRAGEVKYTYEGAPIVPAGLDSHAAAAVRILRRAAESLSEGSPRLPLCLARLGEALVLHSRFTRDGGMREEAVAACERARDTLAPGSTHTAAVYRCLALALEWRDGSLAQVSDHYRAAAAAGLDCDLLESLEAAIALSRFNPLQAAPYFEIAIDALYRQLGHDGRFTVELMEQSVEYVGDGGIIGGHAEMEKWYKPAWAAAAAPVPNRIAYAWASAGRAREAILAIERQRLVLLDCGARQTHPPSWPELLEVSRLTPLVYLAATEAGACALILNAAESPEARSVPLPDLTSQAVGEWLHGPSHADAGFEGLQVHSGAFPGPDNPLCGGIVTAYSWWQMCGDDRHGREIWFAALDRCGEWLGKTLLEPLERAVRSPEIVLIVSGRLAQLPLASAWLPDEAKPRGRRYLIDSFLVRQAPSARVFFGSAVTQGESFFGVADPASAQAPRLGHAHAEADLAASAFPASVVVSDEKATLGAVRSGLLQANIIHLACHAFCHFEKPSNSAILLAGDETLSIWDLVHSDVTHARLVILSACESSKTTREVPEQAISFAHAFLGAGAASVIASSWDLDDPATGVLMLRFYFQWRVQHAPPHEALRESQQWLRDTTNDEKAHFCESLLPDMGGTAMFSIAAVSDFYQYVALLSPDERSFSHPHFWASFTYSGSKLSA